MVLAMWDVEFIDKMSIYRPVSYILHHCFSSNEVHVTKTHLMFWILSLPRVPLDAPMCNIHSKLIPGFPLGYVTEHVQCSSYEWQSAFSWGPRFWAYSKLPPTKICFCIYGQLSKWNMPRSAYKNTIHNANIFTNHSWWLILSWYSYCKVDS